MTKGYYWIRLKSTSKNQVVPDPQISFIDDCYCFIIGQHLPCHLDEVEIISGPLYLVPEIDRQKPVAGSITEQQTKRHEVKINLVDAKPNISQYDYHQLLLSKLMIEHKAPVYLRCGEYVINEEKFTWWFGVDPNTCEEIVIWIPK